MLRDGVPRSACRSAARRRATGSWCGRARRSRPTAGWSEGSSAVDTSMLTGESVPVEVRPGRPGDRRLRQRRAGGWWCAPPRSGPDTQLARMARLVDDAQNGKAAAQRLADRVSGGVRAGRASRWRSATLGFWLGAGAAPAIAVTGAVAVLIIACPCALGLATAHGAARRHRPRRPARHPDQRPGGAGVDAPGGHGGAGQDRHRHHRRDGPCTACTRPTGWTPTLALRLAGAVEQASEHPIGRAIAARRAAADAARPARSGRVRQPARARRARRGRRGRGRADGGRARGAGRPAGAAGRARHRAARRPAWRPGTTAEAGRAHRDRRGLGRGGPGAASRSATRSGRRSADAVRAAARARA